MSPARARAGAAVEPVLRRPVAPMLAVPMDAVPEGPDLVHEPKWDGSPETSRCLRGETPARAVNLIVATHLA